ncbi:MAG: SUMF1/EgtB/PvdO family nonheme iron enzyme [Rhodomicrobium sp.]
MADIFISYSKKHAQLTADLARDLEAEGYSTWWDTGLLPDDVFFPETIRAEIAAAKAVIVIWAEHSITSRWVYSEATEGDEQGKLLQLRDESLDPRRVPLPFKSGNIPPVADRAKILAALNRRKLIPSARKAPSPPPPPPPVPPRTPRRESSYAPYPSLVPPGSPAVAVAQAAPDCDPLDAPPASAAGSAASGPGHPSAAGVLATVGVGQAARARWLAPGESFRDLDIAPEMVVIPPGEFRMGSKDGEGDADERPRHKVTIPQAFAAGKYPVTFAEWDAALAAGGVTQKANDYGWGRGRRPVVDVSWDDAQAYVKWLASKTGQPYRLLSEAEWEYACRAGTETAYSFGNSITKAQAQFSEGSYGSAGKTVEVGSFPANRFGLHDMHGNVWEWCEDCWNDSYKEKPDSLKQSGGALTTGDCGSRALRGGSWVDSPANLRSAFRIRDDAGYRFSDFGFRLARTLTL